MNGDNKRRIDNARDALVGILPDPKGQVEQITTALMYKFLSEQDAESIQAGGKASYFIGKYRKFSWENILSPKITGDERAKLYAEALESMGANPKLPDVFQQALKGAYSPFRGAHSRALNLFLHEINQLNCSHTEDLGDAYEHLLSIMGTQGDAGQFRTPRHIIDFIVEVVNPQIGEKILDPACGSAGFLSSAHKHIVQANTNKKPGDKLTQAQKRNLSGQIEGRDIDPGMVRLALVNLFLHNVKTPRIEEFDTLSDDSNWNKKYDVILANPPFMNPKGGIQPHDKFTVRAKRAEVLFVDYIAEHLIPQGRAGIIVPEGIITRSDRGYQKLRKHLIDNWGLYAVVSLPAGIFQPYSPVKTSVLFLDKTRRQDSSVLFVKIENDGFALGAQRKKIEKNDLPSAFVILKKWRKSQTIAPDNEHMALAIEKITLKDRDYNLTGDHYRETVDYSNAKFPMIKLSDICTVVAGEKSAVGEIGYLEIGDIDLATKSYDIADKTKGAVAGAVRVPAGTMLISTVRPTRGAITITQADINVSSAFCRLQYQNKYVLYMLYRPDFFAFLESKQTGATYPTCKNKDIFNYQIPLPPLAEQEQIVAEISGHEKVRNNARLVVKNWQPSININTDYPMVKIGDICDFNPKKSEVKNMSMHTMVSFLPMSDLNKHFIEFAAKQKKKMSEVYSGYTYFRNNDVLLARVTPCFENGKSGIARNLKNDIGFGSSELFIFRANMKKVLPEWIYYFISSAKFITGGVPHMSGTSGLQRLTKNYVTEYKIPLPPLAEQKRIVADIESEQRAVDACRELCAKMDSKIAAKIAEAWREKS